MSPHMPTCPFIEKSFALGQIPGSMSPHVFCQILWVQCGRGYWGWGQQWQGTALELRAPCTVNLPGDCCKQPRNIVSESNLGRDSGSFWKECIYKHVAFHSTAAFWRSAIVRLGWIILILTDLLGGWVTHLANSLGYWYQSKSSGSERVSFDFFLPLNNKISPSLHKSAEKCMV